MDYEENEAAEPGGDGCLPIFLLPPLAVLGVGLLLGVLLLGPIGVSASADDYLLQTNTSFLPGQEPVPQIDIETNDPVLEGQPTVQEQLLIPSQEFSPSTSISSESSSNSNPSISYSQAVQFSSSLSPIFTQEIQYWGDEISEWSSRAGVDPNLAATVMQIESCGDPQALSRAGAIGLFQVMPFHFQDNEDPFQVDTNALRGLGYLKQSFDTAGGDIRLTLAGYNGGIGVINRSESTWAGETIRYTYWGSGIYTDASNGSAESLRLQEWLYSNGLSLCKQAAKRLGIAQ